MVGTGSSGHGVRVFAGLLLALFVAAPVAAQSRLDVRTAQPRALVQAWRNAAPADRAAIAEALIARRAQTLPTLRDTARTGDQQEKLFALSMIAEMRDRAGVDTVVGATTDGDVKVRRRAATTLRLLADGRAAARLRAITQSETDLGVLKSALAALGRLGQQRDIQLIAPFLLHGDRGVTVVAAGSLAMLGDERGLEIVLAGTYSADPGVQKSATYALGLFTAADAGVRLQEILADPQGAWKSYALIAQAERSLAAQSKTQQVASLDTLAHGRSRTLAEWAVDRLTDIGGADAAAALRKAQDRPAPVGPMAKRRLQVLEAQP